MNQGVWYEAHRQVDSQVNTDDCLEITVECAEPSLAAPFNKKFISAETLDSYSSDPGAGKRDSNHVEGYRVDNEGYILFPLLGKVKVLDMTFRQVSETIRKRIIEGGYINDPQVSCRLVNFKYTVLGAVAKNGVYETAGTRVTLLEAIANAGDLTSKARADRVLVIREENGSRVSVAHNLQSKEIFDSPFFYLKQNDVVYVEPRYGKKDNEDRNTQYFSLLMSLASVVTSVIWILAK